MEILEFQQNNHLVAVYYKHGKLNLFRIHVDVTLADLKHQLSQLNGRHHFRDERRVTDVNTKGSIKLDAKLIRSIETICSNLIRPRTFDEIAAFMVELGEDKV
ncbi:hypothetical protein A2U01_0019213 [Trifolium medium]|uniref:Uncharacterized protein n=1 Tax=Trifolium medium TaxID=97028 RepID=A0A392NFU9_9FABA|nr:hypothetical protein [Trifolium medium]